MRSRVLPFFGFWALTLVTWHLFVGQLGFEELAVGSGAALVVAFASMLVLQQRLAPLRARLGDVLQIVRLPRVLVTGTREIVAVLFRHLAGRPAKSLVLYVPFDAGGEDDESAFRRALAIAYTTSTPNFVVVGVDIPRRRLVYHQLEQGEIPEMTQRLGAEP